MRILQIHKYYSKRRGGGSVTAFLELTSILRSRGHEVAVFSMKDEENLPSDYEKYFISHFDLNEKSSFLKKINLAGKVIFNREANQKLGELIEKEKPEIAHLHNIYHYLSPSIILALRKKSIPIVMTLHDYKLICPNYKLFNKGKICEKCKDKNYYHCFLDRCLKNSYASSLVMMFEAYLHKFLKTYEKVDLFIAPSRFMKDKCVEFGIPAEKICVLKNPFNAENFKLEEWREENYFLYYGRLSEEKGIGTLLMAMKKLSERNELKDNKLFIVGKGPQENDLRKKVSELGLEKDVHFLGFRTGEELRKIIAAAKFTVLPSVWHDNLPLVVLESQLLKKPILVSDLGGSKELIINNETGMIFKGGNVDDLTGKVKEMINLSQQKRKEMGEKGRENALFVNDEDELYAELIRIYEELIKRSSF